jgi:hypothetical protein
MMIKYGFTSLFILTNFGYHFPFNLIFFVNIGLPSPFVFQKDYEELAENVMNIVDRVVHKTDVRTMLCHA